MLEVEGKLLVIKGFTANSAAKDAGLKAGAVIIGIDDNAIESFTDYKLAVMDKKPGDSIKLDYLENTEAGKKDKKSVKLELR
jgi:S1-C subfamily serine protease